MEELMNLIEVIKIPKHMSFEKFNDKFGGKTYEELVELGFEVEMTECDRLLVPQE